uniref:POTRA domain-containing protein n=1 Tax=Gastroclonium compressum TaxID=1852973 RepID=A0A173G001_GASCM|nr:hypothetical protein [Coeloseira compressa]ANH09600.1 hypothetical protein [Coeloseira compressa]
MNLVSTIFILTMNNTKYISFIKLPLFYTVSDLNIKINAKHPKLVFIQKIQFEDSNKFIVNKLLNKNILIKKNYLNNSIYSYINSLQKSGYFNRLKILQSSCFNKNYTPIIIKAKINPIVSKIYVKKHEQLLVYKTFLIELFKNQIGLPKNYVNIIKSIQIIQEWYKKQNFDYVQIKLLHSVTSDHILIQIDEGIINNIQIIEHNEKQSNQFINDKIKKTIQEYIKIQKNDIFNTKKIEDSILHLKKIPFIKDCSYQIKYLNNKINLTIYYIIHEYSMLNSNYQHIAYKHTIHYITDYFKRQIKYQKQYLTTCMQKTQQYMLSYQHNQDINKYSYTINSHLQKKYSINLSRYFLKMHEANVPFIYLFTLIYIKHNKNHLFLSFIKSYVDQYLLKQFQNTNLHKKCNSINIIKHYLLRLHIKIKNCLLYTKENYKKSAISLKTLYFRKYETETKEIQSLIYDNYKIVFKFFRNIIYLKISFEYNKLFISEYLTMGNILITNSVIYYINNFSHSISSMYIHIYKMPNLLPYFYKSIINIYIKTNLVINFKQESNNNYKYCNIQPWLNSENIHCLNSISYYLLSLEYHLYKSKYMSFYIFYNKLYNFLETNTQIYFDYEEKLSEIKQGIGLQINMPIKILSNIKLTYTKQYKNNKYLISLKYYSIADINQ